MKRFAFLILAIASFAVLAEEKQPFKTWSYDVPAVAPQSASWSCGANIGSRMLQAYGFEISYETVKKSVIPYNIFGFAIGPSPKSLAKHLSDLTQNQLRFEAKVLQDPSSKLSSIDLLIAEVKEAPVMILCKVGVAYYPFVGRIIQLHWMAVTGYNEKTKVFTVADTGAASHEMTHAELEAMWDWDVRNQEAEEFNPLIADFLEDEEVFGKTIIRVAPASVPVSEGVSPSESLSDAALRSE